MIIFYIEYGVENKSNYTVAFTEIFKKSDSVDNIQEIIDEYCQKVSKKKRGYTEVIPSGVVVFYKVNPARFSEEHYVYKNKMMFKTSSLLMSEFKALTRKNSNSQQH